MLEIFASVRDLHTNYVLPPSFSGRMAFLPFLVEAYVEAGERRYLVSHLVQGFDRPPFARGVEVVSWNGVPIDRAVALNAQRFAGSNPEARRARGIERLTVRPLILSLPPDEDWVIVGYRTGDGQQHELRVDWLVAEPGDRQLSELLEPTAVTPEAAAMGVDIDAEMAGRAKKVLFAPRAVEAERARAATNLAADDITSQRAEMSARIVETERGRFGYVRIWTFAPADRNEPLDAFLQGFVGEFVRLLEALPQEGLIVDVRGNGGGIIFAGEMLLQLLTPRRIEPERLQFINTPLNLELCRRNGPGSDIDLSPWVQSMAESVQTGAVYSRAFPITPEDLANGIGQRYHGPVVLITDARCYSTTDIFAAGFQDHEIGVVLGVDLNTGAGGANVWTHALLRQLLPGQSSPYRDLPNGTQMRVAIRQTLRVGERAGTLLEDLGVVPDQHHPITRNDLLSDNVDLIERAASILVDMPARQLRVELASGADGSAVVHAVTRGLNRLDVYADGRPQGSVDVSDGPNELELRIARADELQFEGFDGERLVAARRLALG
jgi:C-terminal processing protease CtpA/Prc